MHLSERCSVMATLALELDEDAHHLWSKWKKKLGFLTDSLFVRHLLKDYEADADITQDSLAIDLSNRHADCLTPTLSYTENSDQADSGQTTPLDSEDTQTYDQLRHKKPLKKQRGFNGLESVVRRLHQAKADIRDADQIEINQIELSRSSSPEEEIIVKLEIDSDDELSAYETPHSHVRHNDTVYSSYQQYSPKILPESVRTVLPNEFNTPSEEKVTNYNQISLRSLLERPPISPPFVWSREVKHEHDGPLQREHSTHVSPMDLNLSRTSPCLFSPSSFTPTSIPNTTSNTRMANEIEVNYMPFSQPHSLGSVPVNTNSVALESLVRLAAQAKRDEGLKEKESMIWKSLEKRGVNVSEIQKSFSGTLPSNPTSQDTSVAGPTLKEILLSTPRDNSKDISWMLGLSKEQKDTPKENAFPAKESPESSSATSALQQLAHLKDSLPYVKKEEYTPKIKHKKSKADKHHSKKMNKKMKRELLWQKGGGFKSKKKKKNISKATVKNLLTEHRTHKKSQHAQAILERPFDDKKREGEDQSSASQMLLSLTSNYMSDHLSTIPEVRSKKTKIRKPYSRESKSIDDQNWKANKMTKKTELQPKTKVSNSHSLSAPPQDEKKIISEAIPAYHVIKFLAEKGQTDTSSSDLKVSATSINSSASEVMKLLASKKYHCDEVQCPNPVPLDPLPQPAVPQSQPDKSVNGAEDTSEMTKINEQPNNSLEPFSPMAVPLNLMFMSPPAHDSSRAFSLMKQLITKSTS